MKRIVLLSLVLVLSFGMLYANAQSEQKVVETVVLKLGHGAQPTHPLQLTSERFAAEVKEKTQGRVEIQVYPNIQLGEERAMVEGLQLGTVDFVITSTGPTVSFVPETGVIDLPFLFTSSDHAYKVLDGEIGQSLLAKFEPKGIIGLSFMENGWRSISANKKIVVPADLKGLKVRTMQNKVHMSAFSALGASPLPMAWGEVYTSLQQGVINGQENPPVILATNALWEVQKFYALTRHFYTPYLFLMSKSTIAKVSAEDLAIIKASAKDATAYQRKLMQEQESGYLDTLKKNGMEVYDVDRSLFQAATKAVYDEYQSVYGKDLIDKIIALGK